MTQLDDPARLEAQGQADASTLISTGHGEGAGIWTWDNIATAGIDGARPEEAPDVTILVHDRLPVSIPQVSFHGAFVTDNAIVIGIDLEHAELGR